MPSQTGRYAGPPAIVAEGWKLERLTPPSRLCGANGLRTGADGRIYVAQVAGSRISAVDVDTGEVEVISPTDGGIVAPDDLVFDPQGNLFATEITEGRVSVRSPNGKTRVVCGDMPCANPITFHKGRLFAGECRPGGRIMELDLNGGAPRVVLADVPMPNAMDVGPDGKLYVPIMGTNEIWRLPLEGGAPEKVAADLGVPDSVKFDSEGFIVSTQVASGQVLRIDPRTGARVVLADIAPGLDNVTFVGKRIFVSSISGQINEIVAPGKVKSLVPDGLNWPLGLATAEDGSIYAADGPFFYSVRPGSGHNLVSMLFSEGSPGYIRGVAASAPGEIIVTTAMGVVARYRPAKHEHDKLAEGLDQLYGIAIAPGGAVVVAERGTGRILSIAAGKIEVLAEGLRGPSGVAIGSDSACFVSEEDAGRIVKLSRGRAETVVDGLKRPEGILLRDGRLYILDVGARALIEYDLAKKMRRTLASELPVGTPQFLKGIPPLSGPMGPFAGLSGGAKGALYLSADAEGSVLAVRPN